MTKRVLIAHGLQNANYFRHRLALTPGALVIAQQNQGPSVGFRLYDPAIVLDPARWGDAVIFARKARSLPRR